MADESKTAGSESADVGATSGARPSSWNDLAAMGVSLLIGAIGAVPAVFAASLFEQMVLAPLGLAQVDTSFRDWDGPSGAVSAFLYGFLPPILLLLIWTLTTRAFARKSRSILMVWVRGVVALSTPTIVLVQLLVWRVAHA